MEKCNKLRFSPNALNDLEEIWQYISEELKNTFAAANTVSAILDSIDKLKNFTQIGAPLSAVIGLESDYRFLVCGNYLVFYRTENESVYIDRILLGKQDYLRILFEDNSEK